MEEKQQPKSKTISINGYDVPEPVREPLPEGTKYYIPSLQTMGTIESVWLEIVYDYEVLELGLVHLDKESALAYREAVLSLVLNSNQN